VVLIVVVCVWKNKATKKQQTNKWSLLLLLLLPSYSFNQPAPAAADLFFFALKDDLLRLLINYLFIY
jgi:hypothetical protein